MMGRTLLDVRVFPKNHSCDLNGKIIATPSMRRCLSILCFKIKI